MYALTIDPEHGYWTSPSLRENEPYVLTRAGRVGTVGIQQADDDEIYAHLEALGIDPDDPTESPVRIRRD